jgi:hypothetical protein
MSIKGVAVTAVIALAVVLLNEKGTLAPLGGKKV